MRVARCINEHAHDFAKLERKEKRMCFSGHARELSAGVSGVRNADIESSVGVDTLRYCCQKTFPGGFIVSPLEAP